MANTTRQDQRFGDIAVSMNLVSQEKIDRALVVQSMIFSRTKVHMPIGKVLKEMSAITQEQINTVLETQKYLKPGQSDAGVCETPGTSLPAGNMVKGLCLKLPKDKLSATICPSDETPSGITLETLKGLLADRKGVVGLIDDDALTA